MAHFRILAIRRPTSIFGPAVEWARTADDRVYETDDEAEAKAKAKEWNERTTANVRYVAREVSYDPA